MRLLRLDPKDFRTVATLVPHRAGTPILSILPFKGALVRLERAEGLHRLVILRADGSEQAIAFDDPAYAIELPDRKSVVEGKSVSVRVDLGGRRNIKKQKISRS